MLLKKYKKEEESKKAAKEVEIQREMEQEAWEMAGKHAVRE